MHQFLTSNITIFHKRSTTNLAWGKTCLMQHRPLFWPELKKFIELAKLQTTRQQNRCVRSFCTLLSSRLVSNTHQCTNNMAMAVVMHNPAAMVNPSTVGHLWAVDGLVALETYDNDILLLSR
jgi:hypothetical protein